MLRSFRGDKSTGTGVGITIKFQVHVHQMNEETEMFARKTKQSSFWALLLALLAVFTVLAVLTVTVLVVIEMMRERNFLEENGRNFFRAKEHVRIWHAKVQSAVLPIMDGSEFRPNANTNGAGKLVVGPTPKILDETRAVRTFAHAADEGVVHVAKVQDLATDAELRIVNVPEGALDNGIGGAEVDLRFNVPPGKGVLIQNAWVFGAAGVELVGVGAVANGDVVLDLLKFGIVALEAFVFGAEALRFTVELFQNLITEYRGGKGSKFTRHGC